MVKSCQNATFFGSLFFKILKKVEFFLILVKFRGFFYNFSMCFAYSTKFSLVILPVWWYDERIAIINKKQQTRRIHESRN